MKREHTIAIYTDGSYINSHEYEGFGWAYVVAGKNFEKSGKTDARTIIRAELIAVINALKYIANYPKPAHFDIFCDNTSVVKCFTGAAGRHSNKDLWNEVYALLPLIHNRRHTFTVHYYKYDKTKSSSYYAERADLLAYTQANRICSIY